MTPEQEVTVKVAAAMLEDWREHRDELDEQRDRRVRIAYESGLGKSRIAQLTGLNRGTVDKILREPKPCD